MLSSRAYNIVGLKSGIVLIIFFSILFSNTMNIYASNLNYIVRDEELNALFAEYGEVEFAKVIMDRETGRSRGFGFVEMPNDEEAARAIEALNQFEHRTKVLNVNEARPKTERPARSSNYGGGGGGGYNSDRRGGGNRY